MQPNTTLFDAARQVVAILETSGYLDGNSVDALRLITAVQRVELTEMEREREQLAAERDRLAADLDALRTAPPALPAPEMAAEPAKAKRRFRAKQEPADSSLTCPECGQHFVRAAGMASHRSRKHGVHGSSAQKAPVRPGIRLVEDGPIPFRCEVCHRDTFARDLHQPDRCVRCAKRGSDAA